MPQRARRQHVVSQFYLKGFADDAHVIQRVSLPGDTFVLLSTSDATVQRDFYTITFSDGSQSDGFEQAFSAVEGVAAEALAAILAGTWPIDGSRREAMSTWIALQHLRSEDVRTGQTEMNADMIRLVVGVSGKRALRQVIERADSRSLSEEELNWEWEDLTKPGGPNLRPNIAEHMQVLTSLMDGTSRYLYDCHWSISRFTRRALVTSDHPVSLLARPDREPWDSVGLLTADAFLVPLSRRTAITIQPPENLPSEGHRIRDFEHPGTTKLARSMNQHTAGHARKYVYHHPDDAPLDGLYLPDPARRQWAASGVDGMIREEGLFSGLREDQMQAMARVTPANERSDGFTINDLAWPIPGRQTPDRPSFDDG
jgi:hypothetical protein